MQATDTQIESLLQKVFGSPEKTIQLLAPNGWQNSPFVYYHHSTPEQVFAQRMRLFEAHKGSKFLKTELPVLEEIKSEHKETPVKPLEEFLDLFGNCLWKIFSDNHEVYGNDGVIYDIGSFRGSGHTIADFINERFSAEQKFDYMDFYCGMMLTAHLPVQKVYELIFERLKQADCDWRYSHPHMYLLSFAQEDKEVRPEDYNPATQVIEEIEKEKRKQEIEKLQTELDDAAEQQKQESIKQYPQTVIAYKNIYGGVPDGFI